MPRMKQVGPGEWQQPIRKGYRMACCDCGLVHTMEFRIVGAGRRQRIQFRAWRNNRSTAALRREDAKRKPNDAAK